MRFPKISRHWLIILSLISGIVLSLGIYAYINPLVFKELKNIILPSTKTPQEKIIILELQTEYSLCKHIDIDQIEYKSDEKLQQDFESKVGYHLLETLEDRHIYQKTITGHCKNCSENQFLGIHDGKVAVLKGTPNQPGPVIEYLNIQIHLLPQAELNDLSKGIPFKDEKEKLQFLEGLNEMIMVE